LVLNLSNYEKKIYTVMVNYNRQSEQPHLALLFKVKEDGT